MRAAAPLKPRADIERALFPRCGPGAALVDSITAACGERVAPAPEEPGAEPDETPAEAEIEGVVAQDDPGPLGRLGTVRPNRPAPPQAPNLAFPQ